MSFSQTQTFFFRGGQDNNDRFIESQVYRQNISLYNNVKRLQKKRE